MIDKHGIHKVDTVGCAMITATVVTVVVTAVCFVISAIIWSSGLWPAPHSLEGIGVVFAFMALLWLVVFLTESA